MLPVFHRPVVRDAALAALAWIGVGLTYVSTSASLPLAIAAAVAVSGAFSLHSRLAMGRWRAAIVTIVSAVLIALLGGPPRLVYLLLAVGLVGAELIARRTRRTMVLRVGTWLAGGAALFVFASTFTAAPMPALDRLREAAGAAVGGFLSAQLLLAFGPLAEWALGHRTRLTLAEWLNYEHPLLRRLATAAPGTFQHSINVGLLADAAAHAIGADALLARVGGMYHDVGKMLAPEYFVENQGGHDNPHDALPPLESARRLRAHVTDGVDLVLRHRMGERIADFVREHHGTSEMRIFVEKARAMGLDPNAPDYRYPGPRPRSRETAVVMIADQLEATARANPPVDEATGVAMVRDTIARIQGEEQLVEAGFKRGDLQAMEPAFARALQAMYHRRLTYPPSSKPTPQPVGAVGRSHRSTAS